MVGVEGVEAAVYELQKDSWLDFTVGELPSQTGSATVTAATAATPADTAEHAPGFVPSATYNGSRRGYVFKTGEHGTGYYRDTTGWKAMVDKRLPLTVVVADFFELTPAQIGQFQGVWDRGSLVAIPPHARKQYVRLINSFLVRGGTSLLVTVEYDEHLTGGPPYSMDLQTVKQLYEPLGFKVQLLSRTDVKPEYKEGKWVSVPIIFENVFLITKVAELHYTGKRWYRPWTWLSA